MANKKRNIIKVLHILPTMSLAGTEMFIINNFRNIDKTRFEFIFLSLSDKYNNLEQTILKEGGSVFYCNLNFCYAKSVFKNILSLSNLLRKIDYDVLHCHVSSQCGPIFLASFLAGKGKCIAHSHFSYYEEQTGGILRRFIYKTIFPYFMFKIGKKFCACSPEAGDALFGQGSDYEIVKNGIDLDNFINSPDNTSGLRKEFGIPSDVKVYGNISRIAHPKNIPFVIDVFNEIHKVENSSILILVGKNGDLYNETIKRINEYALNDSVRFLGQRSDVNLILNMIDCIIFPSENEGFGLSVVEAQAASTPVVCSDCIPSSADLNLGLVRFLSLNEMPRIWADIAMSEKKTRINPDLLNSAFIQHRLCLSDTARHLEKIYESVLNPQ